MSGCRRASLLLALLLLTGCQGQVPNAPPENALTADLVNWRNGLALLKEGRVDEAIQLLKRARESYPRDPNVPNTLGLALLAKKEYTLAIKAFDDTLRLDPTFVQAANNKGVTLMEMDRLAEAEAIFQAILDGEPTREKANAQFNLGLIRVRQERLVDAERHFSLVLADDPKYLAAYRERGLVRVRRDDFRGALDDLLRYLRDEPKDPAANYNAALCLLASGHRDLATRYMERVVAAAPDSEEAGRARRFLAGEAPTESRRTP